MIQWPVLAAQAARESEIQSLTERNCIRGDFQWPDIRGAPLECTLSVSSDYLRLDMLWKGGEKDSGQGLILIIQQKEKGCVKENGDHRKNRGESYAKNKVEAK